MSLALRSAAAVAYETAQVGAVFASRSSLLVGFVLGILATLVAQWAWGALTGIWHLGAPKPGGIDQEPEDANQTVLGGSDIEIRYYLVLRSAKKPGLVGLHFGPHPRPWLFIKRQLAASGTTEYHRCRDHADALAAWERHHRGVKMPHFEHA